MSLEVDCFDTTDLNVKLLLTFTWHTTQLVKIESRDCSVITRGTDDCKCNI